jgi:hypothetical protein
MPILTLISNPCVIILCTLILLWIITVYNNFRVSNNIMTGFWEADKSFLTESGLESLTIYFGKNKGLLGARDGYILIKKDSDVIINEPVVIKISKKYNSTHNYKTCMGCDTYKEFDIQFKDIKSENFPEKQSMKIYPTTGKIILYIKDTVYAVLYKNSVLSELSITKN